MIFLKEFNATNIFNEVKCNTLKNLWTGFVELIQTPVWVQIRIEFSFIFMYCLLCSRNDSKKFHGEAEGRIFYSL